MQLLNIEHGLHRRFLLVAGSIVYYLNVLGAPLSLLRITGRMHIAIYNRDFPKEMFLVQGRASSSSSSMAQYICVYMCIYLHVYICIYICLYI